MSAARTLAEGNWLKSVFAEALYPDYTLERDRVFRDRMDLVLVVDNNLFMIIRRELGLWSKTKGLQLTCCWSDATFMPQTQRFDG